MKASAKKHNRLFSSPSKLSVLLALTLLLAPLARAQEVADTIRVRTRVVFMDALVKDKRTGTTISNLQPENFEVFDDGKPRTISYFTREGQARKPLALTIIFDCNEDGAGRFLKRPEIITAMSDQLSKLPPGDEVGIMAMNIGEDEKRIWLSNFTSDRAQLAAALARLPEFVEKPEQVVDEVEKNRNDAKAATTESGKTDKKEAGPPDSEVVVSTEIIKGKDGAVLTRTTMKDGTVKIKRVNKGGNVTIEMNDVYDMASAIRDATDKSAKEKPNSQAAIVWVSDGIAPIFYEDRDATQDILIRSNAIFNSLTVDLRTLFKFLVPIGKPIAGWFGVSLYGSAKYLAKQTGGEAVKVSRVSDYGAGLARVFGNLTARYSLGFALAESEKDDGRMHELAVQVKAVDEKGKQRKFEVSSRRGYYMPKDSSDEAAANK